MSEVIEKSKEFVIQASEDLRNASPLAKAAFIGSTAVIGAHIAGAEYLYANIGVSVFKGTESNYILTGAAVAGTSAAVETISSLIVSSSTSRFPRASEWLHNRNNLSENNEVETKDETKINKIGEVLTNSSIMISLGSPGYILSEWSKNPKNKFKENFKVGTKAISALAAFNFTLVTGVAAALKYAQQIGPTAEKIIQKGVTHSYLDGLIPSIGLFPLVRSPLTWISLYTSGMIMKHKQNKKPITVNMEA